MSGPAPEQLQHIPVALKVVGGTTVSAWTATIEPFLGVVVGLLTVAVLVQTLWKNHKK